MGTKPDDVENAVREAYLILRGSKENVHDVPHWDDLSESERDLLVWVARFAVQQQR